MNCVDPTNPYQCSDGKYPDETKTICLLCTVGHFCKNGVSEACPSGTLAIEHGLDECLQCPNGMNCADPIRPEYCPAGQYPNDSQTSCLDCQPGNYCVYEVFPCQVGRNCSQYGLASVSLCITLISLKMTSQENDCKKGFQCSDPTHPAPCQPGTFASNINTVQCENCLPGVNCSQLADTQPSECAIGFECSDPANPKPCSPGFFNPHVDGTSCQNCAIGTNCSETSESGFQRDADQ